MPAADLNKAITEETFNWVYVTLSPPPFVTDAAAAQGAERQIVAFEELILLSRNIKVVCRRIRPTRLSAK
jgi:hypothetical protein